MLTVTAPEAFSGSLLREELAAAGVNVDPDTMVYADGLLRFEGLGTEDRSKVEGVAAAHVAPDPEPEPDPVTERLDAIEAEVRGIRDRAAAAAVTNADAAAVRDAVAGPAR